MTRQQLSDRIITLLRRVPVAAASRAVRLLLFWWTNHDDNALLVTGEWDGEGFDFDARADGYFYAIISDSLANGQTVKLLIEPKDAALAIQQLLQIVIDAEENPSGGEVTLPGTFAFWWTGGDPEP
jgi:hypothetical protein